MIRNDLFNWMLESSPFEVSDLINEAYKIHLGAPNKDDIEFIVCEIESDSAGRIVCIKNGEMLDGQSSAWIGSPIAFGEMQRLRLETLKRNRSRPTNAFSLFDDVVHSSVDDSVGGFTVKAGLCDGAFHYGSYVRSYVHRIKTVRPGEAIPNL